MNPYIELYRGIAALMVMTCHYAAMLYGGERTVLNFLWTGVDFFFVISGFVFSKHLFSGKIVYKSFFIRRFFRIYPLYFLSVWLYFFLRPDNPVKLEYLIDHLFFLHTLHSQTEAFYFNAAYWSLPVEVEYYLILPVLALWVSRSLPRAASLAVFALLIHLAVSLPAQAQSGAGAIYIMNFHLPGLLVEFMIGALAARLCERCHLGIFEGLGLLAAALVLLAGLGWYFVSFGDAGVFTHPVLRLAFDMLCALAYATILTVTVKIARRPGDRASKVFAWAGQCSYGVYLFHNATPLLLASISGLSPASKFALCGTATILFSIVIHRWYEGPLLRYGIGLSNRGSS